MYIIVSVVMLLRGFADAIMMRLQLFLAKGGGEGYLHPDHYDQIFTAHGVIMIFFVAMGLVVGMMNISVPLQIGARDVAFPLLNSLSFWLFAGAAGLMMLSLVLGEFAATGWMAYPPLSGIQYSHGVGVDYYIWALQVSGLGTLLSGVNFFVTIIKMRARHEINGHAYFHVDFTLYGSINHCIIPCINRYACNAYIRPLLWLPFLHK